MHAVKARAVLLLALLASALMAGCGEDTYKADPKSSPVNPKGGRLEKEG